MEIKMTDEKQLKEELAPTVKTPKKERREVIRHDKNPFIIHDGNGLNIPIGKKGVRLTTTGKNSENILMNTGTGETAMTNVVSYKKTDSEKFIKLFTSHIALSFDLSSTGIKAFMVLAWALQHSSISKDVVSLDKYAFSDFMESNPDLNYKWRTLQRGITELVNAGIIARHTRPGNFYINPYFIFNGDRIAFSTVLERDPSQDHGQKDLLQ